MTTPISPASPGRRTPRTPAPPLVDSMQDRAPVPATRPRESDATRVLLTVEEAAARLGIGRTTMFELIRRGDVESVRIGRLRRVRAVALDTYAASLSGHPAA